jgi:mono/diheme cytochrome c family protein
MRIPGFTLAVVLSLAGCRGWNSDQPPVHLNWNMDTQERSRAFKATPDFFADGRMMRQPVEGTVARGNLRDDDHLTLGVVDGEPAVKFPGALASTASTRARGKERFAIYCAPCHGKDGDGKGYVSQAKGLLVPPPSFFDARFKEMPNGKVFAAITNGVNNGNMPAYNVQIPTADRWAIVAFLRELQRTKDPTVADEPAPGVVATAVGAERGAGLYKSKGCNACHSIDGTKVIGPTWQGLWGSSEQTDQGPVVVDEAYVRESILTPMAKITVGYPPAMPPQALDDNDLASIILYMQSLK